LLITRDLLNNNLHSWLDHAIINGKYIVERAKAIHFYVKRSNLKDGNPIKPSPANLFYLSHLPDNYHFSMKSFFSTMRYADVDILDHLARLILDPSLKFEVLEYIVVGRRRMLQEKVVSGFEALNYAIDMLNGIPSPRFNHVRSALRKVKEEFDSFPK
jgi:hypothetical protein